MLILLFLVEDSQNVTLFYLLLSLNVPHTVSTNLVSSLKHFCFSKALMILLFLWTTTGCHVFD